MTAFPIPAIDVHAHYGKYDNSPFALRNNLMSANIQTILQRAGQANVRLSIITSIQAFLINRESDVISRNEETAQLVNETDGLFHWVVVNPRCPESYAQAATLLKSSRCAGIKIHPVAHGYEIAEYAMELVGFATEHGAVIQSHTGEACCLPEHYVEAANAFPEATIILSHLGCGHDGDLSHQVRAIRKSKHGNIYTDTSSANSITANLIEWAVGEIGAEHILFGTDTPLYFTPMQRARIDFADISEAQKRAILHENALRIFRLPADILTGAR